MDTLVTGNIAIPDGRMTEVTHRSSSQTSWKHSAFYKVPYTQLTATSGYFRQNTAPNQASASLTYPNREIFEIYLEWTQSRIVHRRKPVSRSPNQHGKPGRPSKARQLANGVAQAAAASASISTDGTNALADRVQLARDYENLISLWVLGIHIQDHTLADTVMSILQDMVYAPHNDLDIFFAALTPELVAILFQDKADKNKVSYLYHMVGFIIVTIGRFASHHRTAAILEDTSYEPEFLKLLYNRLVACAPVHLLPDGFDLPHPKMLRIALPCPPFHSQSQGMDAEPHKKYVEYWSQTACSGEELQQRAVAAAKLGLPECQYHLHRGYAQCWRSELYPREAHPAPAPQPTNTDLPQSFLEQLSRVD